MKLRPDTEPDQTSLNMHSLIDIVFLLLVFFVMTLNIVDVEGDFAVRMPIQGESPTIDLELPLQLRLYADENGDLKSMTLNQLELGNDFNALQKQIVWLIGQTPEPGQKTPRSRIGRRLSPQIFQCYPGDHRCEWLQTRRPSRKVD